MIYLDNAATGFPKDAEVLKKISDAFMMCGNPGRSGHIYSIYASEQIFNTRETIADFFGTHPEKVILCNSATYALNMAIKGLHKKDSKILISDLEHNSVIRPCFSQGRTVTFETDMENDDVTIKNFEEAIDNNVSMAVTTHASNVCGRILPVEKIADICKNYNIPLIVDASQTAGCIPIDLTRNNIDVVCIPGHKGLFGPMGTGAMIINPKSSLSFNTIIEGGTGIKSADQTMPVELPERLEAGTLAVHDFAGLETAVKRCRFNIKSLRDIYFFTVNELKKFDRITLYGESKSFNDLEKYMPVILLNIKDIVSSDLSYMLSEMGFCTRSGFHCSPLAHQKLKTGPYGAVRISIGKKNSLNDCKKLLEAVKKIILK